MNDHRMNPIFRDAIDRRELEVLEHLTARSVRQRVPTSAHPHRTPPLPPAAARSVPSRFSRCLVTLLHTLRSRLSPDIGA
jgi:hypothetical protein